MEDSAGLGGGEFVRGLFGFGTNDEVGGGKDEDGVADHEVGLGHGGSVPFFAGFGCHGRLLVYEK